ncbi:uncharacterized protein DS421_15g504050 [Arachis hypogaea]|nr:uncharacterized protein DS421_15g504050 [Arachis hypogaea]
MVTDRISTACLFVVLSQVYMPGLIFLSLLALDIASHWLQMYRSCISLLLYMMKPERLEFGDINLKCTKQVESCSVNFEFANYTIITSKCKRPNYPPKECYGAFKEFAYPYADVLNDLQNDIYLRIQERIGLIPGVDEHELQDKVDKHSNDVAQVPGGEMKLEQGANDFGQLGDRTEE